MSQKGFNFEVYINHYGEPTKKESIELILKPFFQFVKVDDVRDLKKSKNIDYDPKAFHKAMKECQHCDEKFN